MLICAGLVYAVAGALDEAFQRHTSVFLWLWVFIPVTSWWFVHNHRMDEWTREPKNIRLLITLAVVAISLGCNRHYLRFEQRVGHALVDGYEVDIHEDDSSDSPGEIDATIHSAHWYTTGLLYLLRLLSVATEFMLPALTWSVLTPKEVPPAAAA